MKSEISYDLILDNGRVIQVVIDRDANDETAQEIFDDLHHALLLGGVFNNCDWNDVKMWFGAEPITVLSMRHVIGYR